MRVLCSGELRTTTEPDTHIHYSYQVVVSLQFSPKPPAGSVPSKSPEKYHDLLLDNPLPEPYHSTCCWTITTADSTILCTSAAPVARPFQTNKVPDFA
jgi:hypothetical protein